MNYKVLNIRIKKEYFIAIEFYDGDNQALTSMYYHVPKTHIKKVHSAVVDMLGFTEEERTLDKWDKDIHTCIDKTLGYR